MSQGAPLPHTDTSCKLNDQASITSLACGTQGTGSEHAEGPTKHLASLSGKLTPSVFCRLQQIRSFLDTGVWIIILYVCAVPPESGTKALDEDLTKWVECGNSKAKRTQQIFDSRSCRNIHAERGDTLRLFAQGWRLLYSLSLNGTRRESVFIRVGGGRGDPVCTSPIQHQSGRMLIRGQIK